MTAYPYLATGTTMTAPQRGMLRAAVDLAGPLPERIPEPMYSRIARRNLLRALHPTGFRDLRALWVLNADQKTMRFAGPPADDLAAVEKFAETNAGSLDVYMGVATRTRPQGRRKNGCGALYAAYADLDFKTSSAESVRQRLAGFALRPSAVVMSGNGLQVYWFLDQPLDVSTPEGVLVAEKLMKALAHTLGGDSKVADVAHVLRIPGTWNHKYGDPRPVVIEVFEERRYAVADFDAHLNFPADDQSPKPTDSPMPPVIHGVCREARMRFARAWVARQPPAIEGEAGDNHTYAIACAVSVGFDLNEADAYEVLREWNARCVPPWPERELRQKLRKAPDYAKEQRGGRLTFRRAKERVLPNDQYNVALALAVLGVELVFDSFAQKAFVLREGRLQPLDDAVTVPLWLEIDERFRFRPSREFFDAVLKTLALKNARHPVREYLDALRWDGTPRLDTWLVRYAGAADTGFVRAVGALVIIAAARRVREPGCKFDELLVLESPQGMLKSSALRLLCPNEEWFSDDLPLNVDAKQVIERTGGKWIIEASELQGNRASQAEHLKAMLSRQRDGPVRLAYERLACEKPRQFVIVGTTNARTGYLKDATGGRRFWPVTVTTFDLDALTRDRDQLWAEAAHREAAGESIRLSPDLYAEAGKQQDGRRLVDPWEELLCEQVHLDVKNDDGTFAVKSVEAQDIWMALGVSADKRNNTHAARVAEVMQRFGFNRKKKVWVAGDDGRTRHQAVCWLRDDADNLLDRAEDSDGS